MSIPLSSTQTSVPAEVLGQPHPAVAAGDPRRPGRARRPLRSGHGDAAARAAHAAADRALPDRDRRRSTRPSRCCDYMLRPSIEECLNLWFGKSEQTDQEIWNRFGADVALASRGHYDHWALNVEHPRLLVALVIMLDQFPPQHVPRHAPRCMPATRAAWRWSSAGCASASADACARSSGSSSAWR